MKIKQRASFYELKPIIQFQFPTKEKKKKNKHQGASSPVETMTKGALHRCRDV